MQPNAIGQGLLDSGIDGFEDHSINREGSVWSEQSSRATEREANGTDAVDASLGVHVANSCPSVFGFKITAGVMFARTLAIGLKIENERPIACLLQKAGSAEHASAIAATSMEQHYPRNLPRGK
jgi:hypothetical protein